MFSIYADECVDHRIVLGVRQRGVDIVTAVEHGLRHAPDTTQLERALQLKRVILSADPDFIELAKQSSERHPFPGLLFVRSGAPVGRAIEKIVMSATQLTLEEMIRRCVIWIT